MTDEIIFQKTWEDCNFMEIMVLCSATYITARQSCYIASADLDRISKQIECYVHNPSQPCYLQVGVKEGNFPPAFSLDILEMDRRGHVQIEADLEIADNESRKHRCSFYVETELGLLERFGKQLPYLAERKIGEQICLNHAC